MAKPYTLAIVGGGLMGRLLAWRCAKLGIRTALYEKASEQSETSAAHIAASMLAPMAEAVDTSALVLDLAYQSLEKWQQWIPELTTPVFFQQNGSLIVWHGQDIALANVFKQRLKQTHQQQQLWHEWNAQDITQHEPTLHGRFRQGLFLPCEGQLDNRQVLTALYQSLINEQVSLFFHSPIQHLSDIADQADWVIDCRGIGAKKDWNNVTSQPSNSTLRGVRGEVARVFAPDVQLNRPVRLLHPRYPLYICPKENHLFVVGATQLESEDDSPVSVRSSLELFSALYSVCPAFGEARILELSSALRPTLSHEDPEIRINPTQKTISINGLFRHGFMIAPAVCQIATDMIMQLLAQQTISHPHSIIRFGDYHEYSR